LKSTLLDAGAGDMLYRLLLRYHGKKEVTEWAVMARDTLSLGDGSVKEDTRGAATRSMFDDSVASLVRKKSMN
jgi:hypothetical protein